MRLCAAVACLTHTHGERFGKETIIATKNKNMDFILRPWKVSDAKALARHLNNKKIWDNCRDGLPFPYTETDADAFIKYASEQVEQNEYASRRIMRQSVISDSSAGRMSTLQCRSRLLDFGNILEQGPCNSCFRKSYRTLFSAYRCNTPICYGI